MNSKENSDWTKEEYLAYEIGVRKNYNNITDEGWDIVEKALLDKAPHKPNYTQGNQDAYCSSCDSCIMIDGRKLSRNYCDWCGTAIDWSDINEN